MIMNFLHLTNVYRNLVHSAYTIGAEKRYIHRGVSDQHSQYEDLNNQSSVRDLLNSATGSQHRG